MISVEDVFDLLEEIPYVGNTTGFGKVRDFVETRDRTSLLNIVLILAVAGFIISLLMCAIVHKTSVFKRREKKMRTRSFQERKCSSCRSLSCDHVSNLNRL